MEPVVEISTVRYEAAHRRKPRGFGLWYFHMPDGVTFCFTGTYVRALRAATARVRRFGDGPARILLFP